MGYRFRFYHVPKTGGTSIFGMTRGIGNHKRASKTSNHVRIFEYPPDSDEIAYAVTRHPYSRYISAFYHMVDACNDEFFYKNAKVSDCDWLQKNNIDMKIFYEDPNEFLYALNDRNHPLNREALKVYFNFDIFRPQMYWLGNYKGLHPGIKILLEQSILKEDFGRQIEPYLDGSIEWPQGKSANSRITKDEIQLTQKSKEILQKLYPLDFEQLGYQR